MNAVVVRKIEFSLDDSGTRFLEVSLNDHVMESLCQNGESILIISWLVDGNIHSSIECCTWANGGVGYMGSVYTGIYWVGHHLVTTDVVKTTHPEPFLREQYPRPIQEDGRHRSKVAPR